RYYFITFPFFSLLIRLHFTSTTFPTRRSSDLLTVTSVERIKPIKFLLTFLYLNNLLNDSVKCLRLFSKVSPSIAFRVDSVRNNQRAFGFSLTTSSITL